MHDREDFVWRGLGLCLGRRTKPVLELVRDVDFPALYRIRYPNGWTSSPGNLTRAHEAAYSHARYLLAGQTGGEPARAAGTAEGGDRQELELAAAGDGSPP